MNGWRVRAVGDDLDVVDPAGRWQLRVTCAASAEGWEAARRGRIPLDAACTLQTPAGEQVTCRPRAEIPLRRRSATRDVTLAGRAYSYRPTTDRVSVLERDGVRIARLHRSWQLVWSGRRPSTKDLGFTMEASAPLDALDEALVVAFGAVIAPPGHEGAVTRIVRCPIRLAYSTADLLQV